MSSVKFDGREFKYVVGRHCALGILGTLRPLPVHNMGVQQQIKVWKIDEYVS